MFVLAKWREILALRSARTNQREEIPGVYLEKLNHIISKVTKYELITKLVAVTNNLNHARVISIGGF